MFPTPVSGWAGVCWPNRTPVRDKGHLRRQWRFEGQNSQNSADCSVPEFCEEVLADPNENFGLISCRMWYFGYIRSQRYLQFGTPPKSSVCVHLLKITTRLHALNLVVLTMVMEE
jgi:hypothetical protein